MAIQPRYLTETAVQLIMTHIQSNITTALAAIAVIRPDNIVSLESPESDAYFYFAKAHGYRCPAIFVIDDDMDFRQQETKANFINALLGINVTVKVEDQDADYLTKKAWRYQAALHSLLDQTSLVSADSKVKLVSKVRRIRPTGMYTYENSEPDSTANFFKEYELQLEVDFFENF